MLAMGEAQIFSSEKEQLIVKENQAGKNLSSVFNKPDFFYLFFFLLEIPNVFLLWLRR